MIKALLVLAAAIAFAAAPFLVTSFDGFDPNQYPIPQVDPPVQPEGYAFSIWGVIYLWLVVHAGVGVWRHAEDPSWDATRWPLIVSLGVGSVWLSVATVSPVWATVLIWVMLISALFALLQSRGGGPVWALGLPLGLYAGWLTAASFVSIGLLGAGYGVLFGEVLWAYIALTCALVLVYFVQIRINGIWTYGFAAGWGFLAIAVQNVGANLGLVVAASLAAVAVAVTIAVQIRR
ncbi:hypothetical protein [Litoreibacter roseus]|uniref:Seryl-tRNA synthetase n=1 Tax=Litoreibacter roseus TaxID=2601869 RepID=A0A6N6JKZ5_9RHOB|nr:hypothetical protein [Litoreibacter roseus]GFE65862.1 seryl-tRNA synthetase [Litoreibacter roseus]